MGIGAIVGIIKLPFYLDSIGTLVASVLGGFLYGSAAGILSAIISAFLIYPTAPAYVGTAVIIALSGSFLVKYGFLRLLLPTVIGGLLIGLLAAITSAPVTTYLYGGVTLAGTDAVTALFKAMGNTLLESVVFGGLATDPIDKLVTSIIAMALLKSLPKRIFHRFSNGPYFLSNKGTNDDTSISSSRN